MDIRMIISVTTLLWACTACAQDNVAEQIFGLSDSLVSEFMEISKSEIKFDDKFLALKEFRSRPLPEFVNNNVLGIVTELLGKVCVDWEKVKKIMVLGAISSPNERWLEVAEKVLQPRLEECNYKNHDLTNSFGMAFNTIANQSSDKSIALLKKYASEEYWFEAGYDDYVKYQLLTLINSVYDATLLLSLNKAEACLRDLSELKVIKAPDSIKRQIENRAPFLLKEIELRKAGLPPEVEEYRLYYIPWSP